MKSLTKKIVTLLTFALVAPIVLTACGGQTATGLEGEIRIDGSSTVFPITEAVAEEFIGLNPDMQIPVGVSGTGGGFKKFIAGEIDIADASRPIKDEEAAAAKAAGIEYLELTVAFDGLSVIVNKDNTWVNNLTTDQLKMIWEPGSKVQTWKDIDSSWPDEKIKLYAPGTDSGTFDYFTEEINGESGAIRQDFTGSEDDNVLVQGIAGDKNAIGFFGYAYYEENKDKLKIVSINDVKPSPKTIEDGTYTPLSRPLFIYVNKASLDKKEVMEFLKFYIENAKDLATEVGYIQLPAKMYDDQLKLLK
ncbi:MAG: phosphate transport system substrate-binding protein [Fusobacteria bacterium]|nr:MAG: phosphate transport system substrate-binding protein [Fusobacteriota bacterium]KAF0229272.1 MAG: phosphate transport system substrate-binding [Fusobacteriota bacterium]